MLPETDIERVQKWAVKQTPEEHRDTFLVEVEQTSRALIIIHTQAPWHESMGSEWERTPVAKLLYNQRRNEWSLYWVDRNSKFRRYEPFEPTPNVANFLVEIERDPTNIFWG